MKTKTINGIKIKNTEFSMGEKLFDMTKDTAIYYKRLVNIDLSECLRMSDRRTANVNRRVIVNIDNYINELAN